MLALAVVAVYLAGLIAVGAVKSRRVSGQAGFSLAGRGLGVGVLVGTLVATWTGTGSIFGNAEKAYQDGMATLLLPLAPVAGFLLLIVMCTRVRARGRFTLQDLLEERFGVAARVLGTLTLVTAYLVIVSYQLRAGAAVLTRLAEHAGLATAGSLDPSLMVAVVALFVAAYTALAGMMSVAITDTFNGILMTVGVLVALPLVWIAAGGTDAVLAALPEHGRTLAGHWTTFSTVSFMLPVFLLVLGDANLHQRFLSARSDRSARRAILLLIPCVILIDGAILLLAMGGRAVLPNLDQPGHVILELALTSLPPAVGALLVASILAVVVSTADSFLLSSSTSLVRDVFQRFWLPGATERQLLRAARLAVVGLALAAFGLTFTSEAFFDIALFAYTIYGVGITPPLLAALFWRRATPAGAVSSMATAVGVAVLWKANDWGLGAARALGQPTGTAIDAVIPSILVATVALVLVSLLTSSRGAPARRA